MSQKRASGAVEIRPEDPIVARVRAVTEATKARREGLEKALAGLDDAAKVATLGSIVLDLLDQLTGLQSIVVPLAVNMDQVNATLTGLIGWQAEVNGKLLFAAPPIRSRS